MTRTKAHANCRSVLNMYDGWYKNDNYVTLEKNRPGQGPGPKFEQNVVTRYADDVYIGHVGYR